MACNQPVVTPSNADAKPAVLGSGSELSWLDTLLETSSSMTSSMASTTSLASDDDKDPSCMICACTEIRFLKVTSSHACTYMHIHDIYTIALARQKASVNIWQEAAALDCMLVRKQPAVQQLCVLHSLAIEGAKWSMQVITEDTMMSADIMKAKHCAVLTKETDQGSFVKAEAVMLPVYAGSVQSVVGRH